MAEINSKIRKRRRDLDLTLIELGALSGVHSSHIARIERGERYPSARILKKLAKPLNFTEVELLKVAGYLSKDDSDEHIDRLKSEIKKEILALHAKVDSL